MGTLAPGEVVEGLLPAGEPAPCAFPVPTPSPGLRERYLGCLVGGAIGDALGRPVEGWRREEVAREYPAGVRDFEPSPGWRSGPIGTFTDDTQLTIVVAEHLLEDLDLTLSERDLRLARRIVAWGRVGRGIGAATRQALRNHEQGVVPAGVPSAGNGAAMRAAPYALRFAGQGPAQLEAVLHGSVLTHEDASAAAAALLQSAGVNLCLAATPGRLDPAEFLHRLCTAVEHVTLPQLALRHQPWVRRSLTDVVGEVLDVLDDPADSVFDHFHNGAFVIETLPSVLWCFLAHRDDPERALVTAASGGGDADTVAAMVGNLVGALHGLDAFPARWLDQLEDRDVLLDLADRLHAARWGDSRPAAG